MSAQLAMPLPVESKLLANLDPRAVDTILAGAEARRVAARQRVLAEGQPATHLFMIRRGRARYYKATRAGDEIVLEVLTVGDVLGLGTFLQGPIMYMGSAETVSDCDLLVWNHGQIRALAATYPQLAENALRIVLHYLESYVNRHAGLVSRTAEQRLALTLLDLGNRTGRVHADGVEIDATNEQLSSLADISHFTASRLLNGWVRDGTVSKERGKVVIHAPEALVVE